MSPLLEDLGGPTTAGSKESSPGHRPAIRETHSPSGGCNYLPVACSGCLVLDKARVWAAWGVLKKSVGEGGGRDSAHRPDTGSVKCSNAPAVEENCPLLQTGCSILVGESI